MSRLVVTMAVTASCLVASMLVAMAETVHEVNKTMLGWEMTWAAGQTPAPASEMAFKVYRTLATAPNKENPEFLAEVRGDRFPVSFSSEGKYLLGVRAVRYTPGKDVPQESLIGWSDDPAHSYNKPFSVKFDIPPSAPTEVKAE